MCCVFTTPFVNVRNNTSEFAYADTLLTHTAERSIRSPVALTFTKTSLNPRHESTANCTSVHLESTQCCCWTMATGIHHNTNHQHGTCVPVCVRRCLTLTTPQADHRRQTDCTQMMAVPWSPRKGLYAHLRCDPLPYSQHSRKDDVFAFARRWETEKNFVLLRFQSAMTETDYTHRQTYIHTWMYRNVYAQPYLRMYIKFTNSICCHENSQKAGNISLNVGNRWRWCEPSSE